MKEMEINARNEFARLQIIEQDYFSKEFSLLSSHKFTPQNIIPVTTRQKLEEHKRCFSPMGANDIDNMNLRNKSSGHSSNLRGLNFGTHKVKALHRNETEINMGILLYNY